MIVSSLAFEWPPDSEKRRALEAAWRLLTPSGRLVLGERMLFFDPQANPEQGDAILSEFFAQAAPQGPFAPVLHRSPSPEQPAVAQRFSEEHQEFRMDPSRLARLVEKCGFAVDALEPVSPLLGVIAARKTAVNPER